MSFICNLCPRECGKERNEYGGKGYCGAGEKARICRAALHMWEEPNISGKNGSGTVFFSGCTLRCEYCQNYEISRAYIGKEAEAGELNEIFDMLEEKGAHNINLVTPTHFSREIAKALKQKKRNVPVIYNCSGYEKEETLKSLEGLIDVYLPDIKYSSAALAKQYSHAENYFEVAKKAVKEMLRQVGETKNDELGMIKSGLMVRHLILPSQRENSKGVLDWIAAELPKGVYLSLMSQFTPTEKIQDKKLKRKLTQREYENIIDYAQMLGLTNIYLQDIESSSISYIPEWDMK